MKKLLLLILASLIALLALVSCTRGEPTETGDGTGAGTDAVTGEESRSPEEEAAYQKAKMEALRILTPTKDENAFVLNDDRLYCSQGESSDTIFLQESQAQSNSTMEPEKDPFLNLTKIYLYRLTEGGDAELLCKKEGCTHDGLECTALANRAIFNFTDGKTGETHVYYVADLPLVSIHINGEIVDLSEELGQYVHGWKDSGYKIIHVLFEYNMTTGERRAIKLDYSPTSFMDHYYNGKLYSNFYMQSEEMFSSVEEYGVLMSVDVRTGETAYYGGEPGGGAYDVCFGGMEDGSLYVVRASDGMLMKSAPDFSGAEEIGVVKDPNNCTFSVIDGFLYISSIEDGTFNIYRCKLSGEGELETFIENIDSYNVIDGAEPEEGKYIYYTLDDEEVKGTLYRYSTKTGETEVVFEDGPNLSGVYYAEDERIIYRGRLDRIYHEDTDTYETIMPGAPIEGLPNDSEITSRTVSAYFEYNFSTGVHRVIYLFKDHNIFTQ